MNKKQLGAEGERTVVHHLQQHGYEIIDVNWRCRYGEIDIIAALEDIIYFVEVRTRSMYEQQFSQYGSPIEAMTTTKIKKVKQLAHYYCYLNNVKNSYQLMFAPVSYEVSENQFYVEKLIPLY